MAAVDSRGEVLDVQPLPLPYFLLRVRVAAMEPAEPGQFVMVAAGNRPEPYLRRAFSVYDQEAASDDSLVISLLGKVIGRGTEALAACVPGERIPVLGPLGTGFHSVADGSTEAGRAALVAGGIGSAGLGLLAQALARVGRSFDFFYGGRGAEDLVEAEAFRRLSERSGGRLVKTTEDGSAGERGLITTPLEAEIRAGAGYMTVCTCGPHGLMAAVAAIAAAGGVPGEAATETPMGCGYGACLGCAVTLRNGGYALCCRQGPVFRLDEVAW
jgi:dihydroorotate dehydrogenase electron transfer subunit